MIQILDSTQNNTIATKVENTVSEADINKLKPLIQNIVDKDEKIRWYFEMHNFTGWELDSFWEEIKLDLKYMSDYEKVAMIGEKKWQDWITQFMKPFTNAEIKYFDIEDKDKAKEWINK